MKKKELSKEDQKLLERFETETEILIKLKNIRETCGDETVVAALKKHPRIKKFLEE